MTCITLEGQGIGTVHMSIYGAKMDTFKGGMVRQDFHSTQLLSTHLMLFRLADWSELESSKLFRVGESISVCEQGL